jgi:hypothetical protein
MTPSIVAAMTDQKLFGRWFAGATWAAWRAFSPRSSPSP